MQGNHETYDCAVIGAGPAGLTAALALAARGVGVVLAGPDPRASVLCDTRTTALFAGAVTLLENLDIWRRMDQGTAPLEGIRLIDVTDRLIRAPETLFLAREVGQTAFGHNVPNVMLTRVLAERVDEEVKAGRLAWIRNEMVTAIDIGLGDATLCFDGRQDVRARLVVGADGRNSLSRRAARIATRTWRYPQSAIAVTFEHSRPHDQISTELHAAAGPCTSVPLPGNVSSLVWVETPERVEALMGLDDAVFMRTLERRLEGLLGRITGLGRRAAFPLTGLSADRLAGQRVALVGEAGHVIPPIGAQGLNLGFRDAAEIADCAAAALEQGDDPGGEAALRTYHERRSLDVSSRTTAVDVLNRSLISDLLPSQILRVLGLHALNAIGPLRQLVMREGMQPGAHVPSLMKPMVALSGRIGRNASAPIGTTGGIAPQRIRT